jgi:hypothetical protein
VFSTDSGAAYCGDALDLLRCLPDESVSLVLTSPPYALHFKKAYGNVDQDQYVDWLLGFVPEIRRVLRHDGSFVLNVGFACSEATLRRKIVADVQKTLENMAWRGHLCSLQCKRINPRQAPRRCVEILLEASAEMGTNAVAASAVLTHGRFTSGGLTQV